MIGRAFAAQVQRVARCGAWLAGLVGLVGGVLLLGGCGGHTTTTTTTTTLTVTSAGSVPSGSPSAAAGVQAQYVAVVRATQPEVVQIQTDSGLGSGVTFDTKGDIVTNNHVVSGATSLRVTLSDGRQFSAHLVGAYAPDDLAVISIGAGHAIKPASFAESSKLAVGELVLAVGNPLGLQSSVTDGVISALGRDVSEGQGVVLPDVIQTSAAINPGNSGGALIDLQAQVIGIPTLAAVDQQLGGAAAGIGFAIPSNTVTNIAGQIVRYGHVVNSHRAALGVSASDNTSRPGAVVAAVQAGSAAAKAGIRAGDTIVKVNGTTITSASDLATALAGYRPGDNVTVSVVGADGATRTTTVTLEQLPSA
jgi:S1-C subfamily serine protease